MKQLKIDIVSDVVCPWCAIGYANLETALKQINSDVTAKIHWHPFQLNPYMPKEGQDINEHLSEKYGLTEAQLQENKGRIQQVGEQAGVHFKFDQRARIFNTLDCHILLHFAAERHCQTELKLALFDAYFSEGKDISDQAVLLEAVDKVGLSQVEAQIVLKDEQYKKVVQDEESKYKSMGINSVPAFIINNQYLISGGQGVETFKQSLLEIASKND